MQVGESEKKKKQITGCPTHMKAQMSLIACIYYSFFFRECPTTSFCHFQHCTTPCYQRSLEPSGLHN